MSGPHVLQLAQQLLSPGLAPGGLQCFSPAPCGVWPLLTPLFHNHLDVQLSLWQCRHLLSPPHAVPNHTQAVPCSDQTPQGSAQPVGCNLPVAPGNGREYPPGIMGLTATEDMV